MFLKSLGDGYKNKRIPTIYGAAMVGTCSSLGRGNTIGFKMRKSRNIQIKGQPLALVLLFYFTKAQLSAGMCNGVPNACFVMDFPTALCLLSLLAAPSSVKYCTKLILLIVYWNHVRKCSSRRILRAFLSSGQRNCFHQAAGKAS